MRRLIAAAGLLLLPLAAQAAPDIAGPWLTGDGDAAVDIQPCGANLCGTLIWLRDPKDEAGQPLRDARNPDAAQRSKPLCGLAIFGGATASGTGWENGWIYDPEEGRRYSLSLAGSADGTLAVTGFVGLKALGRTEVWHRAPADLPRCDGPLPKRRP